MKKVLIFTEEKVGEGHYKAAQAIKEKLEKQLEDKVDVKLVSAFRSVHPLFERLLASIYLFAIHYCPRLWNWIYLNSKQNKLVRSIFFHYAANRLLQMHQPELIICTHAACVQTLGKIKQRQAKLTGEATFALGVIFTDFFFHPSFIHEEVDYFFVAHQETKQELVHKFRINAEQVYSYGIPVGEPFSKDIWNSQQIIPLKSKKVLHVLLMGGALGLGPLEQIVELLQECGDVIRITVITGKNKKLYHKLQRFANKQTVILGYVNEMAYWYRLADIVITKPGGITLSEALACQTPVISIAPVGVHEQRNQELLEKYEMIKVVRDLQLLPFYIHYLIRYPEELQKWKLRLREQNMAAAAENIVNTIVATINNIGQESQNEI